MRFARIVYRVAAITGLIGLIPMYFLEGRVGRDQPPAITHPEYYYGFLGLAVVWQVAFLAIARDPARYRPLMLVSVLEKASFSLPSLILYVQGRMAGAMLIPVSFDMALGILFAIAYLKTAPRI
ncbi:hypothetical protein TA3x_003922 [Tundrisphaera sp. TA3]|uniref:hypothetical protein n=1 Tax=Tundrisphaera sp. TA3 TaxID=3435775 RepID=UPI003EB8DC2C